MGVDHRGLDVGVAEQLLNGSQVGAGLQQMGGKGMPQGVGGSPLGDIGRSGGQLDRLLIAARIFEVPADYARTRISGEVVSREYPEPWPFLSGIGILPIQSTGHVDSRSTVSPVLLMNGPDLSDMFL